MIELYCCNLNIKTQKLEQSQKNLFAEKIYEVSSKIIGIPAIEIYFNEYDSYHINGQLHTSENPVITVEVQGPPLGKEKTSELAKAVKAVTTDILGDSKFGGGHFRLEWCSTVRNESGPLENS